ncbi:HU family DNA-binding protein [Segnochrobactrum spirostomi]|uniref:HU family DNA-binding protein n=1 Tax=Segnochrobactrum spirostomi TaxID=2608987 RepID=UPI001294D611|nr:HU family DNA-binding protein [Segnochrobactrum spirostomi]
MTKVKANRISKAELTSAVAEAAGLTKTDAQKAVDATFEAIVDSLKKGEEVRIVGFGSFAVSHRAASSGRDPRTGNSIEIPAANIPKFRAGKPLKDAVNS